MTPTEVKDLRKSLELTQEGFAQRICVTVSTVNRWENGFSKPSRLAIEAMLRARR